MGKARLIRVVPKVVATNPVAAAVARASMIRLSRDLRINLYLLRDGERVPALVTDIATLLAVAIRLQEARGRTEGIPVMAGGMSALTQCSERGFAWRTRDAVAVELALDIAAKVAATASPREARDAWAHVRALEQGRLRHAEP
jgi:hypothetical protein